MQGKELILYDLFGRRILEKGFVKETVMDVGELNAGIYLLVAERKGIMLAREKVVVL